MFQVNVDRSEPLPLDDQVAAEIRRAIADGECGPGQRLPPVRDLAAVLGVNQNTVLRALRLLRSEGLLEFRRGRGVTVTSEATGRSDVISRLEELIRIARKHGIRRDELVELLRAMP